MIQIDISTDIVASLVSNLRDETEGLAVFSGDKIDKYINKVADCNTIFKLVKSTDADALLECLSLIDIFHNSKKTYRKINEIFGHMTSDFCADYFEIMTSNLGYTNEQLC